MESDTLIGLHFETRFPSLASVHPVSDFRL